MGYKELLGAIFGELSDGSLPVEPVDDIELVIDKVLSTLSERERFVIERRFGLNDGHAMTLKQIGAICLKEDGTIGVTGEWIRQVESKTLRKLRHPSRNRCLIKR